MSQNKSVEEVVEEFWKTVMEVNVADIKSETCYLVSDDNVRALIQQERQTSQEREREIVENTAKSVNRVATQNGYALAIKHFEERMSKGQAVFEAIERMKEIHKQQSFTNHNKD